MAVQCAVRDDGENVLVALDGALGLSDVVPVRYRLLKCLAEQPAALLLDLSRMTVAQPLAMAVFAAVSRQAARWPGTPVLLCSPRPQTRALLTGGALRRLPAFPSLDAARRHVGSARLTVPSISDELLPIAGAARQARNVTTDACLLWDLPHLVAPASLVASELVANVVDHAHTIMTLRLSLRSRYLNIAVNDGSPAEPVISPEMPGPQVRSGRGLLLVAATAQTWGSLPTHTGKVVWAALTR